MRTLFISGHFPDDLKTKVHGVYKRMGTFIDAIKDMGSIDMLFYIDREKSYTGAQIKELEQSLSRHWDADIKLTFCPKARFPDSPGIIKWLSFGKGIYSFFNQRGIAEFSGAEQVKTLENCLERKPSAIFAHRLPSMAPILLTKELLPPVVFDLDDIEHIFLSRFIKSKTSLKSKLLNLLTPSLINGEYNAIKLAELTFVCSEKDQTYLENKFNLKGITVIPNSVTIPELAPPIPEKSLLFLGSDYGPNIDAAEFLVKEIWPAVIKQLPDARLTISGMDKEKFSFSGEDIAGLRVVEFTQDLDALYKTTRVVVVPMLVGGGTRFKIIEASAYGKPTVSTLLGAEGIELTQETSIMIRDNPLEFAKACIKLLNDPELCKTIGLSARETIIRRYDRQKIIGYIKELISDAVSSPTV